MPNVNPMEHKPAQDAFFFYMRQSCVKPGPSWDDLQLACEIATILYSLKKSCRLKMDHIAVLQHYGLRGTPPKPGIKNECQAAGVWNEAMGIICPALSKNLKINETFYGKKQNERSLPT